MVWLQVGEQALWPGPSGKQVLGVGVGSGRLLDSSQHLIPSTSSPGHLWQGCAFGHSLFQKHVLSSSRGRDQKGDPPVCLHLAELKRPQSSTYSFYYLLQMAVVKKSSGNRGVKLRWPASKFLGGKKSILTNYWDELCTERFIDQGKQLWPAATIQLMRPLHPRCFVWVASHLICH